MKFKSIVALLIAMLMMLCSCQVAVVNEEDDVAEETENIDKKVSSADAGKYLVEGDWSRRDENLGEALNITFTKDGEYYYNCDCGEPVGNSDIYDSYEYDKETQTIKLSGCDGEKDEIKVLYADSNYLFLMIDGCAHIFNNSLSKSEEPYHKDAEPYMPRGASALVAVLSYEDGVLTIAPYDYDGDAKKMFTDRIYTLEADDDIYFHTVSVTVENEIEVYMEEFRLDDEDVSHIGEYFTHGYMSIGEDGQVEQITFYGETIIY